MRVLPLQVGFMEAKLVGHKLVTKLMGHKLVTKLVDLKLVGAIGNEKGGCVQTHR